MNPVDDKKREEYAHRIKTIVDERVNKFISDLPNKVDQAFSSILLNMLGVVEEGWNPRTYKFNPSGGDKTLLAIFKRESLEAAEEKLAPMLVLALEKITTDPVITSGLIKEARQLYRSTIREQLLKRVKAQAEADADEIIRETGVDRILLELKALKIGSQNRDIDDPKSFEGVLGEVIMEETVRQELGIK